MTNPYGIDPGSQSQGLGIPGSQGPQFVAPGQYGPAQYGPPQGQPAQPYGQPAPHGAPGWYPPPPPPYLTQPPSQQYRQGYQQQPYGPGYPPPAPQPPRRRSSSTAIVVVLVALVALVAGIAYGGYALYRGTISDPVTQPTPTRPGKTATATPSDTIRPAAGGSAADSTNCISGDKITTTAFIATVPANWSCDGDDGDISISSTRNDAIWVEHDAGSGDTAADCTSRIQDLGIVSTLPQETWGGKRAIAYQAVHRGGIFGVRCAVAGGQTWYLMYFPLEASDDATVRAGVTAVMSTWVWK